MIVSHALLDEKKSSYIVTMPFTLLPTLCVLVASQSPSQKNNYNFVITSKQNEQKKITTINKFFVITTLLKTDGRS